MWAFFLEFLLLGILATSSTAHSTPNRHDFDHSQGSGGRGGKAGNTVPLVLHSGSNAYTIPEVLVGGNLTKFGLNVTTEQDSIKITHTIGNPGEIVSFGGFCPNLQGCPFNTEVDTTPITTNLYDNTSYVLLSRGSGSTNHGESKVPKVQITNNSVIARASSMYLRMSFDCWTSSDGYCFLNQSFTSVVASNAITEDVSVLTGPSSS